MTNFDTVREALEILRGAVGHADTISAADRGLTALAELERTHYTAEDVADASAQGFRDGVASVTAGQEPVAWKHDCAALLANDVELWIDKCPHCGRPRAAPVSQQPQEPDWKHPKIQALIGADARNRIAIDLIWQILKDPDGNFSAMDMEYWDSIHDAVQAAVMKAHQPQAEAIPQGYRVVPDWKGYALLGSGQYLINHAANYDPELGAELIITLATEKDREGGRKIGESRPNAEDSPPVQPEEMVIRIGFLNGDALFVLEDQLADVRKVLEAAGKASPQQAGAVPSDGITLTQEEVEALRLTMSSAVLFSRAKNTSDIRSSVLTRFDQFFEHVKDHVRPHQPDPEAVAEGLAQIIFEAINPGKVWTYQNTDVRNAYWQAGQAAKEFLK